MVYNDLTVSKRTLLFFLFTIGEISLLYTAIQPLNLQLILIVSFSAVINTLWFFSISYFVLLDMVIKTFLTFLSLFLIEHNFKTIGIMLLFLVLRVWSLYQLTGSNTGHIILYRCTSFLKRFTYRLLGYNCQYIERLEDLTQVSEKSKIIFQKNEDLVEALSNRANIPKCKIKCEESIQKLLHGYKYDFSTEQYVLNTNILLIVNNANILEHFFKHLILPETHKILILIDNPSLLSSLFTHTNKNNIICKMYERGIIIDHVTQRHFDIILDFYLPTRANWSFYKRILGELLKINKAPHLMMTLIQQTVLMENCLLNRIKEIIYTQQYENIINGSLICLQIPDIHEHFPWNELANFQLSNNMSLIPARDIILGVFNIFTKEFSHNITYLAFKHWSISTSLLAKLHSQSNYNIIDYNFKHISHIHSRDFNFNTYEINLNFISNLLIDNVLSEHGDEDSINVLVELILE